jgi:hypothetical protein
LSIKLNQDIYQGILHELYNNQDHPLYCNILMNGTLLSILVALRGRLTKLYTMDNMCILHTACMRQFVKRMSIGARRTWRYQRGNHNPYIAEEQTTQWPTEKVQMTNNDLQSIHIKLKIEYNEPHQKPGLNSGAPQVVVAPIELI